MESVLTQYQALAKPARAGLAIGAVAILLGTALTLWWVFSSQEKLLFGSLDEPDAAEIAAALDEWKVPHRFSEDGAAILVDGDQVHNIRMRLVSAGIPKGGHVGYELFDQNEFGVTEFAQRINYQRALQGELERTIATIPGVRNVRVHLSIRRGGLFLSEGGDSKASVAVSMHPGSGLERKQVSGIRNLVASAVEGLKPEAVVVVGPSGLQLPGGGPMDGVGEASGYAESASEMESQLEAKIGQLLSDALNGRQAAVSVNVRMNFDKVRRTSERVVTQPGKDHGVVVKRSSNGAGAAEGGGSPVVLNEQVEYAHGTEREEVIRSAGIVERITIAVMLPPDTAAQERERLERLVAAAAGLDAARGDTIEVAIAPVAQARQATTIPVAADAVGAPDELSRARPQPTHAVSPYLWGLFAWVTGLIMGGLAVGRRQRAMRLLSARESEAEIVRIRAWLVDGAR